MKNRDLNMPNVEELYALELTKLVRSVFKKGLRHA